MQQTQTDRAGLEPAFKPRPVTIDELLAMLEEEPDILLFRRNKRRKRPVWLVKAEVWSNGNISWPRKEGGVWGANLYEQIDGEPKYVVGFLDDPVFLVR